MQTSMPVSRRTLLKGAAIVGASACIIGGAELSGQPAHAADAPRINGGVADGADANKQYGFLIKIENCIACEKCVAACREHNKLTVDTPDRRRVTMYPDGKGSLVSLSTSCMHCADPNCVRVCPAGAISKAECGIVSVDQTKCIGCKYCYEACPYGVPRYNSKGMDKCDCCQTAGLPAGSTPYCVQACLFDALKWGAVEELAAENPNAVRIGQAGTPSCLIIA